jgi:ABC-2 type transport system ATP-binding protein
MTPAVELRAVTKSFADVRAVDGLDLTITPGEIVAVLGSNGAGKSTTTELILGLTRPDAGEVRVFGMEPTAAVQAGRVGAMLQAGALLYGATVSEVLKLMRGLHRHPLPLADVIERAQVGNFLSTRTEKLSGGQAQRLRYALAIMPDPDLLILDEPTVAMDVELRLAFWVSMRDFIAGGRTVLFATHYLDEADTEANRIVVLNDGRLVADGRADQIKQRVSGRVVTLAGDRLDPSAVMGLAGVGRVEASGARLHLHSADSDATLRALLAAFPSAHDIEVTPTRLEDAFLALTATEV